MSRINFHGHLCITGTIGSGKSRVCQFLAKHLNLPHVDVDILARRLMELGGSGLHEIGLYNADFLNTDGTLNRHLLRQAIFNNPQIKQDIDCRIHPLIQKLLQEEVKTYKSPCVIEIPLLFETGWDVFFDCTIMVWASEETCLRRIIKRDDVSSDNARKAYASQMDPELKKLKAHFVIENDGNWLETEKQIEKVVILLKKQVGQL